MASDSAAKARGTLMSTLGRAAALLGVLLWVLLGLQWYARAPTLTLAPSSTTRLPKPVEPHVSHTGHTFSIGERVRARSRRPPWARGNVSSVDPLLVTMDGNTIGFHYNLVEALTPEQLAEEAAAIEEPDQVKECKMWAKLGECTDQHVLDICPKSCRLAEEGQAGRILRADNVPVTPASIAMANRLLDIALNGYSDAHHTVYDTNTDPPERELQVGGQRMGVREIRAADPQVLVLDSFLTPAEVQHMVSVAGKIEFESSPTNDESGQFQRTSSTFFLRAPPHDTDEVIRSITARGAALCGSPVAAVEPLQLLKYGVGEFYKSHFDGAGGTERAFTILVYLTDVEPGVGGRSRFPMLNVSVTPRAGSAVFWRNSRDDPDERYCRDYHALHDSESLAKGSKLAMNIWVRAEGYYNE